MPHEQCFYVQTVDESPSLDMIWGRQSFLGKQQGGIDWAIVQNKLRIQIARVPRRFGIQQQQTQDLPRSATKAMDCFFFFDSWKGGSVSLFPSVLVWCPSTDQY
jgi:hypothetical protein